MPDEAVPQTEDTPTPEQSAAPDEDTRTESTDSTAESVDWQERYANLQPEYTRASQEAAEYRQIIDLARQGDPEAIEYLGFEVEDDEDYDEDEDEFEFYDPRVDDLIAEREAEAQYVQTEQELDYLEDYVEGEIAALAQSAGLEDLSDDEVDLIYGALTPGDDGDPDVAGAFKKVTGLRDAHIKSYVENKRRAPLAPSGSSASKQPNLDDDEERRQAIADALNG